MLSHYEHDLNEAIEQTDADHLARIATCLYILRTSEFENIWWRIENRTNQLAQEGQLSPSHLVQLVRAFSHAQTNKMAGSEKTFVHLEQHLIKVVD